jgi:5-methyltetrahydropteroyltriglutamate--homocysteine methyltransferase
MQARPEKARRYAVEALDRALDGVAGTTVVHICFGYAAIIHERPSGYSFLPELERSAARQISIETAQSSLDCSVLAELPTKSILLGVLDLADRIVERPKTVAERIRRALPHIAPERLVIAPDCGMKYLSREVAFGKMRAMVEGARIVRAELANA